MEFLKVTIDDREGSPINGVKYIPLESDSYPLPGKAYSSRRSCQYSRPQTRHDFRSNDDGSLMHRERINITNKITELCYRVARLSLLPGIIFIRISVAPYDMQCQGLYGENLGKFNVCSDAISQTRTARQGFFQWNANGPFRQWSSIYS